MTDQKKQEVKTSLHPRNRNREQYNLEALVQSNPELKRYIIPNKKGEPSVDFSSQVAVKYLNRALLNHYYGIKSWDFPGKNLCPPVPGRADYLHYVADLLSETKSGDIPRGKEITCYDIGVGASCIYPLLGVVEYGWKFIGSDINQSSLKSSKAIVDNNKVTRNKVEFRHQKSPNNFFYGIIDKEEKVDVSICNPPFHSSVREAEKGTQRKVNNLTGAKQDNPGRNFAGAGHELVCEGGEYKFVTQMIKESRKYAGNFLWFTTLVSKQSNLKGIEKALQKHNVKDSRVIPMGTGNKITRIVAWTFQSESERKEWQKERWGLNNDA